jgi:hypothetical protein
MGPQRSCTDQNRIGPSQSLFKDVPIASTAELSSPSRRRSKPPIQTDG